LILAIGHGIVKNPRCTVASGKSAAFRDLAFDLLSTWARRAIVIEQVMIFALGFLIAGLCALAFAPVFWARAVRLSVRRLEMQLPLSMREILADRDQVRAESAVEQRRVELKAEALNRTHADDLAELGRRAARITQMQDHIAGLRETNTALSLDLTNLTRAHTELTAETFGLTKELHDLGLQYARAKEQFGDLSHAHNNLLAFTDEQKANLATVSACGAALEVRLSDTERGLAAAQTMLCNKEAEASLLSSHLDRARDDVRASEAAREASLEKLAKEKAHVAELETHLQEMLAAGEEGLAKIRELTAKLDARNAELREAEQREQELRLKRDSLLERMRSVERGLIDRIDRLRAENSALQGALAAARQECANLSRDLSSLRVTSHEPRTETPLAELSDEAKASMKAHSA
jgi:chromosome segregation ATPase